MKGNIIRIGAGTLLFASIVFSLVEFSDPGYAFTGPDSSAGVGSGLIIADQNNLAVGTTTTSTSRFFLLATSTNTWALHLMNGFSDGMVRFSRGTSANTIFRLGADGVFVLQNMGSDVLALKNGAVGIGTTNPTSTLTVAGEIKSTTGGFRFPDGTTQGTAAVSSGGTVTSIASGAGLTGGPITGSGTLAVNTQDISACTGSGQKIIWSASNNRFVCGTDLDSATTNLPSLGNYVWSAATTAANLPGGVSNSFVSSNEGWQNYGTVINARAYSGGGGGGVQLYAPYGSGYGGTSLQYRLADYSANSSNPPWTSWRTLLDSANYSGYSPTLTGGGASGSWGISVTGSAGSVGGLTVHTGTNNEANKIVRTDGNGYIQAGWINTVSGDNGTTALARIYASSDGYIRYYTPANFRQVLDVPTRTGGGASGSWGISVTGSAGSVAWGNVSGKPFNWAGQSGQPSWLWGSNDGSNYYVWNPSNFSVNYANSAGSAPANGGTATYATYLWSTSHPGSYYLTNYWTGSGWRLVSNHGYRTEVGYADNSGELNGMGSGSFRQFNVWQNNHYSGTDGAEYAAAFYYQSDGRLKKDIRPTKGLSIVRELDGVSFTWKESGARSAGLIAQEVERVFPEAVATNPETGIKSVNYAALTGPIVESLKELDLRMKEKDREIEVLRAEVESLKQRMK